MSSLRVWAMAFPTHKPEKLFRTLPNSLSSSGKKIGGGFRALGLGVWFGFSLIHSFGGLRRISLHLSGKESRGDRFSRSNQCVRREGGLLLGSLCSSSREGVKQRDRC